MNHPLQLERKQKGKCSVWIPLKCASSALISLSYFCFTVLKQLLFPLALQWSNAREQKIEVHQVHQLPVSCNRALLSEAGNIFKPRQWTPLLRNKLKKKKRHFIYYGYSWPESFSYLKGICPFCFCVGNVIHTSLEPKGKKKIPLFFKRTMVVHQKQILYKNFKTMKAERTSPDVERLH